jgi:hypothetical protein
MCGAGTRVNGDMTMDAASLTRAYQIILAETFMLDLGG